MKRVHVFEFEDAPWFPAWMRASMTRVLVVLCRVAGVTDALAELVARVLAEQKIERVVDLGSGAGGVMPGVVERVREHPDAASVELLMTDLYPNPDAVAAFDDPERPYLRYAPERVDATDLAAAPSGLRTMVNCFHHMRPAQARRILESARESGDPLLVYELGENRIPFAVWCLALPIGLLFVGLSCLLLTPFARPLPLRQLLFTYVIPLIPVFYAWDGQASMPRTYAPGDLDELLQGLDGDGWVWERGRAKTGAYLLGRPSGAPSPRA